MQITCLASSLFVVLTFSCVGRCFHDTVAPHCMGISGLYWKPGRHQECSSSHPESGVSYTLARHGVEHSTWRSHNPGQLYIWHLGAGEIVLAVCSLSKQIKSVSFRVFTFLSTGNAAVALPKHAAESTDTLGIPPTVVALPSLRNAQTKVSITWETTPTGPVMVTHSLEGKNMKY